MSNKKLKDINKLMDDVKVNTENDIIDKICEQDKKDEENVEGVDKFYFKGYDYYKYRLEKIHEAINKKIFIVIYGKEHIFEMLNYPYRLISVTEIMSESQINSNSVPKIDKNKYFYRELILDSGIQFPNVTNEIILKVAEYLQPDYVVPKDYLNDNKKTIESIHNFIEMKDSYDVSKSELLLPLQKPWVINKKLYKKYDYYAVGGIGKNRDRTSVSMEVVKRYPDKQFHLFGVDVGVSPSLVNSYDNIVSADSCPTQHAVWNKLVTRGEHSELNRSMYISFHVVNNLISYYNFLKKGKSDMGKSLWK